MNIPFLTMLTVLMTLGFACADQPPVDSEKAPLAYRKSAPLFDNLGSHRHEISTEVPLAQRYFNQGLILAYGFNHGEAARSFREAQKLDADCAMAFWGEALVLGPNINAKMDDADIPVAWAALQKALEYAKTATAGERDYIAALAKRYSAESVSDRSALDVAYADGMREVAKKVPDDMDAQTLFAEALMVTTPWDYWLDGGKPKPVTREIISTLERVLKVDPSHPLANHLYIHVVEAAHPEWGVESADRLRHLVPGSGHLVHMPAHIYVRVGRYAEASEANERAIAVDQEYVTACHAQGLYPLAYVPHNHHFLWFSTSMEGRSQQSIDAARHLSRHVDEAKMREVGYGTLQHFYALPLSALIRFGKWDEILKEARPANDLKYPLGVWHYAQGMARARKGESAGAERELVELEKLAADKGLDAVTIWDINTSQHLLRIAASVLAGEIAAERGNLDEAILRLREAVVLEDDLNYDEPPPWYAPVRQALGALLLRADQPGEAERTYAEDLKRFPRNGWSLFGLYQALKAQGRGPEAEDVHRLFETAWSRADVTLRESRF